MRLVLYVIFPYQIDPKMLRLLIMAAPEALNHA